MARRHSTGESNEEIDRLMQIIEHHYGSTWLKGNSSHPICLLWQRFDEMATHELMFLATAIDVMLPIDQKWTEEQIRLSKSEQQNNSRGALFELMALSAFHSEDHPIKPAALNQAGFDGTVNHPKNPAIRISIKNYGVSSFQQNFSEKATITDGLITKLLKKHNYPPIQIYVDFGDHFPEERDWITFNTYAERFLEMKKNSADPFCGVVEKSKKDSSKDALTFSMLVSPLSGDFHPKFNSYTLIISGLHHQNEKKNLYSKLEDACLNLQKHSKTEDENNINSVFVRLPDTVSLENCETWLNEYFAIYPNKPISIIFLYQPCIVTENGTSLITHCFKIYLKNENEIQKKLKGPMKFQVPVGVTTTVSVPPHLQVSFPDGRREKINIEDRYVYQHGELYLKTIAKEDGSYEGNISRPANGVFNNLVIEIPEQKSFTVIQGKFAKSDDLLII